MNELKWFAEGCIILVEDFNIPLSPLQDTTTGHSHVSWRAIQTTERDNTFFSSPHKRYSKIDLIFITQRDLVNLTKAEIGINASDHAPTAINLNFHTTRRTTFNWRLNPALLTDQTIHNIIYESIKQYFLTNVDSDTNPLNNWEAHKSVVRGELIKWGRERKKIETKK